MPIEHVPTIVAKHRAHRCKNDDVAIRSELLLGTTARRASKLNDDEGQQSDQHQIYCCADYSRDQQRQIEQECRENEQEHVLTNVEQVDREYEVTEIAKGEA